MSIDNYLENLENSEINGLGNEQLYGDVAERLKKINKEDLIKLFITHQFGALMNGYKNTRDLNASFKPTAFQARKVGPSGTSLKINFGKKHGFDVKALFALINSNKNLKGIEIGRISLMPEFTIFEVEKRSADRVVNYLKGTSYRGNKIMIMKSSAGAGFEVKRGGGSYRGKRSNVKSYKGKRSAGPSRGFDRKKRKYKKGRK